MAGKETAILMLTALLFFGMIFAGAASAADAENTTITTWNQLKENITNWNSAGETGMLTIVLGTSLDSDETGPNYEGITVSRNITIAPAASVNVRIDAHQKGRIFRIDSSGTLTLRGNESSTLNLTGGMLTNILCFGGAVQMDGGRLTVLSGAEITNCSAPLRGGAVYANTSGEVVLDGGNITDCRHLQDYGGGGAVYVNASTFTLKSGTIADCSSQFRGGAVFASGSNVFMNGGTVTGCSANEGGAVYIYDGTFTMDGGTVTGCSANEGGAVYAYDGAFIMNDGIITLCSADNAGGSVFADSDSTFDMNGGTISDSTAGSGGGVMSYGTFTMDGGTITNCSANEGGAVEVIATLPESGIFALKKGAITDCSAEYNGGAVYLNGGARFMLTGGTITGCDAGDGGGVYVYDTSSFDQQGGTITGCDAGDGGGVYVSAGGRFNVSAGATVAGNTKAGAANNVILQEENCLNLTGPLTGTVSIAYPAGASGTKFGNNIGGSEDDAKHFISDTPGYFGTVNASSLEWTPIDVTVPVTDSRAVFGGTNTTVLSTAAASSVSSAVLEDVSNVVGTVTFKARASAAKKVPATSGYTKKNDVTIFSIDATPAAEGPAYINVSVTFKKGQKKDGTAIRFWHYKDGNWETLTFTPVLETPTRAIYCVATDSFSAFAISLETRNAAVIPGDSRRNQGGSVLLPEVTASPTPTPTPTAVPTEDTPTTKPTQTQKSPAPFVGLIAGLGAAALLVRMRR